MRPAQRYSAYRAIELFCAVSWRQAVSNSNCGGQCVDGILQSTCGPLVGWV